MYNFLFYVVSICFKKPLLNAGSNEAGVDDDDDEEVEGGDEETAANIENIEREGGKDTSTTEPGPSGGRIPGA